MKCLISGRSSYKHEEKKMQVYDNFKYSKKIAKEQYGKSLMKESFKDHTIICNWTNMTERIIRELHSDNVVDPRPIIIITDQPEKVSQSTEDWMREVFVIHGSPLDNRVLQKASLDHASTAIILADPREKELADAKSIVVALAIEAINRDIHTVVEILKTENKRHFEHTHVDELICVEELTEKITAQAALTHGISELYLHLLTQSSDTNEVYNIPVPENYIGKTYAELRRAILSYTDEDLVLVGFITREVKKNVNGSTRKNGWGNEIYMNKMYVNPRKDPLEGQKGNKHVFVQGDSIIVIAYVKPTLENLK